MLLRMHAIIALCLLQAVSSFTFLYPFVTPSSLTINTLTSYNFVALRQFDINLNPTPYASQTVPPGSRITIVFPSQFNFNNNTPTVSSLLINDQPATFNQSVTANNVSMLGAVTAASAIANITVTVTNVLNPYPAVTTSPFIIEIGTDVSVSSQSSAVTLTAAPFSACSVTFTPAQVNTTGAMVVWISPTNKILTNDKIQINFPSTLQWAEDISTSHTLPLGSALTCSVLSGNIAAGSCTGTVSTASISYTITSINGTQITSPFSFQVSPLFSPPTTTAPDTLSLHSIASTGEQIDTCTTTVSGLSPQVLSLSLSASSSPFYVNSGTSLIIAFTLPDTLAKTDYFQLVFPTGTSFLFIAVSTINLSIFSSAVTYTPATRTLLMRQSSSSPTRFAGTVCKITLGRYTAPPSSLPATPFTLGVYNQFNGLKMEGSASLSASPKPYAVTVTPASYTVNDPTSYTFVVTIEDSLLSTAMVGVTFPGQLKVNANSSCLISSNFSSPGTPTCQQNSSNILIRNLTTAPVSPSTYTFSIGGIANADRALITSAFAVVVYYTNDTQAQTGSTSVSGITMQPRQLTNAQVTVALSNYSVLANPVTLNLSFSAPDGLPAGGSIEVAVPAEIRIVSGYLPQCELAVGAVLLVPACLVNGSTFTLPLGTKAITAGDNIVVSLKTFGVNPKSTQPTSPIRLYTTTSNGYLVDYTNTTLQISNFLPAAFSSLSLTPSNLNNSGAANYTLAFSQPSSWDVNSSLVLTIPPTATLAAPVCTNATDGTLLACSLSNGSLTVQLPLSGSSARVNISGFTNPYSLQPTAPFSLTTYSPLRYSYALSSNSLIVTTSTPSAFPAVSYVFSSRIYDTATNLSLTLTNINSLANKYTISPFAQFVNASKKNYSCSSPSFPLTCTLATNTLTIAPTNASLNFPASTVIELVDLWVPVSNTSAMTLLSFQNNYLISNYGTLAWQPQCLIPCLTCLANDSTVCLSCFSTTTFTTAIYYHNNSCLTACPMGTYAPNGSLTCLSCLSPCSACLSSATACTQCHQNSSTAILNLTSSTCQSSCPSGFYADNGTNLTASTPVCSGCVAPCATCTSATVCVTCSNASLFYYNQQCIASCPANVTIANTTTMICQPCNSSCLTCVTTPVTCLSCSSTHPYFISSNSTCLSSCPSPLVPDTNSTNCVACSAPCFSCSLTKTNCTSCLSGSYLSQISPNTCLTTCETFFYSNATSGLCEACSGVAGLNCNNCFNSSYCITCDSTFVLFTPNRSCLSFVPSGYVNISGIATACTNNCAECSTTPDNCTLCVGNFSLYLFLGSGQCLSACPNTTISANNTCTTCSSLCLTCSLLLPNCTSCLTGYLYSNSTTSLQECLISCPPGYFINGTSSACQPCLSPCLTCLGSASSCSSCTTGFLFNSTCPVVCPSTTITNANLSTCQSCVSPCLSCSGTTSNCTSCVANYYYFSTYSRCYLVCPANISVSNNTNGSLNCLPCDPLCLTCRNTVSTCTSCPQGSSLFNSTCITCPSAYYALAGSCQPCSSRCGNCQTTSTTCTSCPSGQSLYQSTCYATCPVAYGYVINGVCSACSSGCLNCSSLDFCYSCPSTSALYNGACVTSCPSPLIFYYNTTSLRFNCFTQEQLNNQTNANTLHSSLQVSAILPLPFTIITSFFFLCCLMSKLQFIHTYITGTGYSLYGCAQTGALVYLIYVYNTFHQSSADFSTYQMLLWVVLALIFTLNAISLIMVTPCLCSDLEFANWLNHKPRGTPPDTNSQQRTAEEDQKQSQSSQSPEDNCCSHRCSFIAFTLVSLVTNFKLKLLIFTKLFRFECLTAHLEDIHGFRVFNVMSFLGFLYEGLYFYIAVKLFSIFSFGGDNQLMFAIIDCLAVMCISMIFALLTTHKDDDFFKVRQERKQIDLGRKKNDKDPKNMIIKNRKLVAGLDSRDKLIDIDDSFSSIADQRDQIVVNHNIDSKIMPKRVSNSWVQCPQKRSLNRIKSPAKNKQKEKNIFDIQEHDDELPFEVGNVLSARDRADLYHTSIKPSRVSKVADSRANDWAQLGPQSKVNNKINSGAVKESRNNFMNRSDMVSSKQHKDMGVNSVVHIDMDVLPLESNSKKQQIKMTQSELIGQTQHKSAKIRNSIGKQAQPIIKQTESENINSQDRKSSPSNKLREKQLESEAKLVGNGPVGSKENLQSNNQLNRTIQEGRGEEDKNISFESVLPFIHENGTLKDKPPKPSKQPLNKIMYPRTVTASAPAHPKPEKMERAAVANSYFIEDGKREDKGEEKKQQIGELLDLSQIQQLPKHPPLPPKDKAKPKIGFAPIQISQMISPQQGPKPQDSLTNSRHSSGSRGKADLTSGQQYNQKIEPGNIQAKEVKESKQVVHAPKTFSRTNLVPAESLPQIEELQQFDAMVNQKEVYLRNLKAQLQKNNNQHSKKSERSSRRRSRKSLVSESGPAYLQVKNNKPQSQSHYDSNYDQSQLQTQQLQEVEIIPKQSSRLDTEWKEPSKAKQQHLMSRGQNQSKQNIFDRNKDSISQDIDPAAYDRALAKNTQSHFEEGELNNTYKNQQQLKKNYSQEDSQYEQQQSDRQENEESERQGEDIQQYSEEESLSRKDQQTQKYPDPKTVNNIQPQGQDELLMTQTNLSKMPNSGQLDQIKEKQEQVSSRRQSTSRQVSRQGTDYIPRQDSIKKPEVIVRGYEVENNQNQEYQEQSKQIRPSNNTSVVADRQYIKQPKFILEQQQADLPEQSYSADNTFINPKNIPKQEGVYRPQNSSSSFDLRKTSKIKKNIPKQQKSQQYISPFVFDNREQSPPLELPLDSEMGIVKNRNIKYINQTPQQSRISQQKPKNQQSHKNIISMLNNAQRNSRSKKKLPKEEKDERILIKMDRTQISRQQSISQVRAQENNNLARKSMEKNKPINSYTIKQQYQDYSSEEEQIPKQTRRPTMLKNSTEGYIPPVRKEDRKNRFVSQKPVSTQQLHTKQGGVPQIVLNFPKKQYKQLDVRQFNFGDEMSSQVSGTNFNSQTQVVKWKENFSRQGSPVLQGAYQLDNIPQQPYIHDLQQLDEDEQYEGQELPKPRSKSKHKPKHRKKHPKKKVSNLEKIYGL